MPSDHWTHDECLEILGESYMVIDSCRELITRAENRLAQLDFESRVDKPFLALVTSDSKVKNDE